MSTISKREAVAKGLRVYNTGKPCKHGHISDRYVLSGMCVECSRERGRNRLCEGNAIWHKSEGHCWYCGRHLHPKNMHVDHFVPKCLGGGDDFDNLVPSCSTCNNLKNGSTLEDFRKRMGKNMENRPFISKSIEAWLNSRGLYLPEPLFFAFWFERQ